MTLATDLLRALGSLEKDETDNLKDVTLIGSDGGRVSATKAVLAIRSRVFRKMFFGEEFRLREISGKCDSVQMNYSAVVLKIVVKYCYTDEIDLRMIVSEGFGQVTDGEAVSKVQLEDAAQYLELQELQKFVSDELGEFLLASAFGDGKKENLSCICAIFQELMIREGAGGPLWMTCLELLKENTEVCFLPDDSKRFKGICACSFPLLETLFRLVVNDIDPFIAVWALRAWNETQGTTTLEEERSLQEIARSIDLESIKVQNLAEIEPCTIFPQDRLFKAFVALGKNTNSGQRASSSRGPENHTVTVRGAGVECANGVYTWLKEFSYYQLSGEYGGVSSVFRVLKDTNGDGDGDSNGDCRWKLDVRMGGDAEGNASVLYISKVASTVPFASWKCAEGCSPTPCFSINGKVPAPLPATLSAATSSQSFPEPLGGLSSPAPVQTFFRVPSPTPEESFDLLLSPPPMQPSVVGASAAPVEPFGRLSSPPPAQPSAVASSSAPKQPSGFRSSPPTAEVTVVASSSVPKQPSGFRSSPPTAAVTVVASSSAPAQPFGFRSSPPAAQNTVLSSSSAHTQPFGYRSSPPAAQNTVVASSSAHTQPFAYRSSPPAAQASVVGSASAPAQPFSYVSSPPAVQASIVGSSSAHAQPFDYRSSIHPPQSYSSGLPPPPPRASPLGTPPAPARKPYI